MEGEGLSRLCCIHRVMGEDPYLAGQMVAPLIQGIQSQQVLGTVKHFACNNEEWDGRDISSEVDQRTLHEIYLPAFNAAVQQGKVGCVLTASLMNFIRPS
jgi:beta-glucosidase